MHADLESKRAQLLGNMIFIASKISESSIIVFNEDGMIFKLVSSTLSLKLEVKINSSFFESYVVFGNKIMCQINNKILAIILKKKWTAVSFDIENEENILIKTQNESNINHSFELFMENPADIDTSIPTSNGTRIICKSDTFDEIMDKFGANDFAFICTSHNRFSLSSQDRTTVLNERGNGDTQIHGREAMCRFIFKDFAKVLKIGNLFSPTTTITICDGEPLSVTASMGHGISTIKAAISSESQNPKYIANYEDDDEDAAVVSRPGISRVTASISRTHFLSESE